MNRTKTNDFLKKKNIQYIMKDHPTPLLNIPVNHNQFDSITLGHKLVLNTT